MNVKYSPCMNRRALIFLAAALLLMPSAAFAQWVGLNRFDDTVRRNFWLDGRNAAGMRQDTTCTISYAELYGSFTAGGFHHSYEADMPWSVGASAQTLVHLKRFSMKGGFSFEQTGGSGMCGSMSLYPGYYPIDALEFTPGRKSLQKYAFDGALSVDMGKGWRLGAGIDFASANYSKRKDLRHTNYRLDFTVTPGFTYSRGGWTFGLNYIFSKNSESLEPTQIGTIESSYYAFLDKGLMYGKYEVWTGSGVHLNESGVNGLPMKENLNGFAFDLQRRNAWLEIEYLHGKGSAGEKQNVWYRFPSNSLAFRFGDRFVRGDFGHTLRFDASWRNLTNSETILEKVTENGVSTMIEHGANRILRRRNVDFTLEYELKGASNAFIAAVSMDETVSSATQMYPFVVDQDLVGWEVRADDTYTLKKFDFSLGLSYRGGYLTENVREAVGDSGVTSELFRLSEWNDKEMDYRTAHRICMRGAVRYNFYKGLYTELGGSCTGAFGTIHTGTHRGNVYLKFGYLF